MLEDSNNEKLLNAVRDGDLLAVSDAINQGANINAEDENGSALIISSLNGNLEIAVFLINNGIDVNAVDEYGRTALMYASKEGYIELVDLLLKNKANFNYKDKQGLTALLLATKEKKLEIIKILIANGANPGNAQKIAAEKGFTQITNYFENLSIEIPNYDIDLIEATKNNNLALVEKALIDGADIETKEEITGITALMYAAQNNNLPIVELLLKYNAEIDAKRKTPVSNGETALMFACAKGNLEIVKFLIKKGADVNAETSFTFDRTKQIDTQYFLYNNPDALYSTALISASKNGHLEVVIFLLDNNAYIDIKSKNLWSKRKTALLFASEYGHLEIVKLLLENKADPHIKSDFGETSLICAVDNGYFEMKNTHLEIIKLLLTKKVDLNAQNNNGETALMTACNKKKYNANSHNINLQIINHLIDNKAALNIKNKDGKTALMLATEKGNSDIVTLLSNLPSHLATNDLLDSVEKGDMEGVKNAIAAGADVDVKNKYNEYSALTLAISKGHVDIVKILLENNANVNLTIHFNRTPLMCAVCAESNHNSEMAKLLLKKKANVNAMDINGMTPLLCACVCMISYHDFQKSYLDIVTLLLEAGADNNIANKKGMTALMYAATIWYPSIAEYLVANGANIYAKDKKGKTAFLYAAANGSLPIIKFLFEKNIDLNDSDKEGNTALMYAAQNGHLDIVTFLVENKADFQIENQSKNNASFLAWYNLDTTEYLLKNKNYNPHSKKNKKTNDFLDDNNINIDAIWGNGSGILVDLYKKDLINLMNRLKSVVDYFQSIWKDNQE